MDAMDERYEVVRDLGFGNERLVCSEVTYEDAVGSLFDAGGRGLRIDEVRPAPIGSIYPWTFVRTVARW